MLLLAYVLPSLAAAQTNGSLPVAITAPVLGVDVGGDAGQLVTYDSGTNVYALSSSYDSGGIYGVTVAQPPLLFSTATNTTPVVTSGSAYVRVNDSAGLVVRGDILIASTELGVATKASTTDEHPFGIALERADSPTDQVLAQIDPVAAKALLAERKKQQEERAAQAAGNGAGIDTNGDGVVDAADQKGLIQRIFEQYSRGTIALIIAVGSLFFVMYTFRSTIVNATLAVGRNPRARNAIMTVSVENIIFALVICALAIFIAIAILVLPV